MRFTTSASSISCGHVHYDVDATGVVDIEAEHLGLFVHQIAAGVLVVAPDVIEDTTEADGEPADDQLVAIDPAAAPPAKPAKKKAK